MDQYASNSLTVKSESLDQSSSKDPQSKFHNSIKVFLFIILYLKMLLFVHWSHFQKSDLVDLLQQENLHR